MRIAHIALALSLSLIAVPVVHAQAEVVASGHIEVGGPHTTAVTIAEATGEEGIDAFFFDAPAAGTDIMTQTTDNSGLGYDLDIYWFDGDDNFVEACATGTADETCTVPDGAVTGEVAAFLGADLDVTVVEV